MSEGKSMMLLAIRTSCRWACFHRTLNDQQGLKRVKVKLEEKNGTRDIK